MCRFSILSTSLVTSFVMLLTALTASPAHSIDSVETVVCGEGTYKKTTVGSVVTFSDAGTCTGPLVIPEGVTTISQYAFGFEGSDVTSVSLPATLNQISSLAPFYGTGALTAISVASTNAAFTSVDGVLFSLDETIAKLIAYPANKVGSTYTTPTSVSFDGGSLTPVTTIAYYAFQAAKNLTTLNISEGVITIMSGIAESATLLSTINLPNSYTVMTAKPFSGAAITSLTIGKFLTSIEAGAFNQTGNLNSITVADDNPNYSSLDGVLFDKDKLKLHTYPAGKNDFNYVVPESVTHIESSAFDSSKVKSVSIPSAVSTMGEGVFQNTSVLTSITVAAGNNDFSTINGVLFNKPPTKLIAYPLGSAANSYVIPAGVAIIGSSAFMSASNLTSVTIPSSVSTFEGSAFFCASSLTNVYFLGNAPSAVGSSALTCIGPEPKAYVNNANANSFTPLVDGKWNGLTVAITYTLTYTYNSATGGNTVASSAFATGDTPITLPTPTRTGYTFAGWYSNTGLTAKIGNAGANYSPTGTTYELRAYAKWTKNVKAKATVNPTVSGTAKVGEILTAKNGTWTGIPTPSVTRQWYACKTAVTAARSTVPSDCTKISGAIGTSKKLASAQKGQYLTVLVTGTSTGTTKTSWLAKSTGKVK